LWTLNGRHRIDGGKYNARFRQRSTQFSMSSAAMQAMMIFAEGNKQADGRRSSLFGSFPIVPCTWLDVIRRWGRVFCGQEITQKRAAEEGLGHKAVLNR